MAAAPSFLAPFTGDDLKKRNNTMMNERKRRLLIAPSLGKPLIKAVVSAMPERLITMGSASFGQTVITGHGTMLAVVGDQAQGRQRACVGLAPEAAADRQGYGWILAFIPLR